jgi:translation initiation factor 2B subunit (eIF-2B alpha/beta/delta family)
MSYTLKDFKQDGIRGSFQSSRNGLHVLRSFIEDYQGQDLDQLGDELNKIGREIIKTYSNMVILRKNITSVVYYLKRLIKTGKDVRQVKKLSLAKIKEIEQETEHKKQKIAESGSKLILNQSKILTISYSSHIKAIFNNAQKHHRKFTVYCMESRPSFEGRVFAEELSDAGIKVYLITDAAIGHIMPHVNMVLTGADRVFETGFISKAGSFPLALVAQAHKIPFYIAFETDKILKEYQQAIRFYQEDAREVYTGKNGRINVSNLYFDSVPLNYISKIICEDGIFSINEFDKWYLEE